MICDYCLEYLEEERAGRGPFEWSHSDSYTNSDGEVFNRGDFVKVRRSGLSKSEFRFVEHVVKKNPDEITFGDGDVIPDDEYVRLKGMKPGRKYGKAFYAYPEELYRS